MKILVTGGSGYLGTHVRRYFGADDFSRTSGKDISEHGRCCDGVRSTMSSFTLRRVSTRRPDAAEEVFLTNVEGTVNLLRNMRRDSVFIFASTKDVYGRFADTYAEVPEGCQTAYAGQSALEWSKLIAERYVEYYANQIGFRSCIFRLSTVYAPRTEGTTPNFVGCFCRCDQSR
jgi:nucleoside-diphosphate-sugar epimerase